MDKKVEAQPILSMNSVEVLYDNRDVRPGIMFADADLLGIPHQIVVGDKGLAKGVLEYRQRKTGDSQEIELDDIESFINTQIQY